MRDRVKQDRSGSSAMSSWATVAARPSPAGPRMTPSPPARVVMKSE